MYWLINFILYRIHWFLVISSSFTFKELLDHDKIDSLHSTVKFNYQDQSKLGPSAFLNITRDKKSGLIWPDLLLRPFLLYLRMVSVVELHCNMSERSSINCYKPCIIVFVTILIRSIVYRKTRNKTWKVNTTWFLVCFFGHSFCVVLWQYAYSGMIYSPERGM